MDKKKMSDTYGELTFKGIIDLLSSLFGYSFKCKSLGNDGP